MTRMCVVWTTWVLYRGHTQWIIVQHKFSSSRAIFHRLVLDYSYGTGIIQEPLGWHELKQSKQTRPIIVYQHHHAAGESGKRRVRDDCNTQSWQSLPLLRTPSSHGWHLRDRGPKPPRSTTHKLVQTWIRPAHLSDIRYRSVLECTVCNALYGTVDVACHPPWHAVTALTIESRLSVTRSNTDGHMM